MLRMANLESEEVLVQEQENMRSEPLGVISHRGKYHAKWTGKSRGIKSEPMKTIITDKYLDYLKTKKGMKIGNLVFVIFKGVKAAGIIEKINGSSFTTAIKVGGLVIKKPIRFNNLVGSVKEM